MAQLAWTPDPDEFRRAWDKAQSLEDLCTRLGIVRNTLYRYARETGLDLTPKKSTGRRASARSGRRSTCRAWTTTDAKKPLVGPRSAACEAEFAPGR